MTEKITDHLLLNLWKEIFGKFYNTKGNSKLFKNKIPDGWSIINKNLFVIENKANIKDLQKGKNQLFEYYYNLPKLKNKIYLILGLGNSEKNFKYIVYEIKDNKPVESKLRLTDFINLKQTFDILEVHKLNQYLYDNGINLPKSQKTLFIASILICLKIDPLFIDDFSENENSYIIADKMIKIIHEYYNDHTFTNIFNFIKKSIHNNHLYELFKKLENDINTYGKDILNQFYSEFCIYDKNNDASLGVVLTPNDIVELMIKELDIKSDESVLDFCTGTGSFLIKASHYTKHLIGCENNDERYSLAKCNFILNDLDYSKLYYNSCFNQIFEKYDKIIINPPFSCQ